MSRGARGFLANDKSYFWARDVTETRAYPADDRRAYAIANELTKHLKDEGWESVATTGSSWWSQRFRRKIVG